MDDGAKAKANIIAYWNTLSPTYDDAPDHRVRSEVEHEAWLAVLRPLLPPPPPRLLDLGTGTGFLALLLTELGHQVLGIDIAAEMLTIAREKAAGLASPPEFRVGDATAPPVAAGSVDAIVSRHLLWTLPDPLGALENWHRTLCPGGRLIVIDGLWALGVEPDAPSPPPPADDPYATYYTPEVRAQLPLLGARSLDQVFTLIAQAGFAAPQTLPPEALARLIDAAHGGGHEHSGRFVVTAMRGG